MCNLFRFRCTYFIIILTLILCACIGGCSFQQLEEYLNPGTREPLALVISNKEDLSSNAIYKQISKTLDYTSIPYFNHDLSVADKPLHISPSVKLAYITTNMVEQLKNDEVELLIRFVAEGHQLIILAPVFDDRIAYLMGLKKNPSYEIDNVAEGYHFHTDIFPGYRGRSLKTLNPYQHRGIKGSEFIKEKNVLATAINDTTYPVITERKIGQGSSIFFNTIQTEEKDYRGLIFSAGLRVLEGYPYRIANASTIFLDDFPAPLYNEKLPPVDEEYDITHAEFVHNVWWPDMKALADSFDISYTALLTFNYNATVVPPFNFDEWEANKFTIGGITQNTSPWLAQDISKSRHELGFHGYNHFSLWLKDWQNEGFMEAALRAARKRWTINNLGTLPQAYVPPTNEIDSVGLASINKAFSEIKYMSSIYNGDVEDGGGREFGPDPYIPSLFNYPRVTSGFVDNEFSMLSQNSMFLYTGIWTHFIHPDDVFQVMQRAEDNYRSRNPLGLGWHSSKTHNYGLYEVFKQRLERTVRTYPGIRFQTVSQSVPIVRNWLFTQSHYHVIDSTLKISTETTKSGIRQNKEKFWFVYVSDKNRPQFERALLDSETEFAASNIWDGKLYQFLTTSDTLALPVLNTGAVSAGYEQDIVRILADYRDYTGLYGESRWVDTRFEDALSALKGNPTSESLQDTVIALAVEFDSLETAISVLEKRIIHRSNWSAQDIEQLLKFYGWRGQLDRAFSFLEQLWTTFSDHSIIMFKNMMVERYGAPSLDFQKMWAERELVLEPENELLLRHMVYLHYSNESWPERKHYIKRLIDLNPRSDTLYKFALDNSIAYDEPQNTLEWLREFPDEVSIQLQPLAASIAYLYANEGETTRALMWTNKTDQIPNITELEWLLQQKRYHDFITRSEIYMKEQPSNDSLRAYIGLKLIFEHFVEEGYDTLYPLFEQDNAQPQTKKLVYTEIGYMDFEQKKQFYNTYPSFFPDSLKANLNSTYRQNEGFEIGTSNSFATDNYENEKATLGIYAQWGDRSGATYRFTVEEGIVSSNILENNELHELHHLNYRYSQSFGGQATQLFISGGTYFDNQKTRPELSAGILFSKPSSFTSTKIQFEPVFTNRSIQLDMNQIRAEIYRDDYWFNNNGVQSTLSLSGKWYSNNVLAYEGLFRLYWKMPFSTRLSQLRPLADLSYADATEKFLFAMPYYTPDKILTKGGGMEFSYKNKLYDPGFSTGISFMAKHNIHDGTFYSGNARLSARINKYWQLSLQGALSTSNIYRYNHVGLNISHIFPKKFVE
ncbi:hypothetical protein SAMN05443144_109184 [Fodinibius roseus]|uniref:DUF2194 domain-containing protein n=1 Tax=Fodinibius roseus TaxID=1194090 RepID=A0A1M5CCM8_9BACT|nr:DUF2194 domain-containing protein [Fodinibius roseus]SHF52475.1 hypothetical protein SAMN05443144_109184 [Fodinibius roseus]